LLTDDPVHIQASVEFLRCLSGEPRFARDLFEILIVMVQSELAVSMPPRRGYEAIIGMLNWVLPLDVERSMKVLLDTLYTKVCLERIPSAQTPEAVSFRTRCATLLSTGSDSFLDHFPFDQALLRPLGPDEGRKTNSKVQKDSDEDNLSVQARKRHLLRDVVIISKKVAKCHIFRASFSTPSHVKQIRVYFSTQPSALYKLDVLVSVGNDLVFHQALSESQYARYVRYKRAG
jgi:hypothetical protein